MEVDSVAAEAYRKNFPDVGFCGPGGVLSPQGDIQVVRAEDLLAPIASSIGPLGLIIGGPPCQGFSYIGRRRASDPRNMLYRHFIRLLGELRPTAYLLENVPGIMNIEGGQGLCRYRRCLTQAWLFRCLCTRQCRNVWGTPAPHALVRRRSARRANGPVRGWPSLAAGVCDGMRRADGSPRRP